jgi:hypothetical protein
MDLFGPLYLPYRAVKAVGVFGQEAKEIHNTPSFSGLTLARTAPADTAQALSSPTWAPGTLTPARRWLSCVSDSLFHLVTYQRINVSTYQYIDLSGLSWHWH